MRILLVEDEEDSAELTAFVLRKAGADVTIATSIAAAVSAHGDLELDLVLTDLSFPDDEDPIALVSDLKAKRPTLPVVALSGRSERKTIDEMRAAGVRDFLVKPVEVEALLAAAAVFKPDLT